MANFKKFLQTKGFLLAVGLCVAAAGIAGVNAINHMFDGFGAVPQGEKQQTESKGESIWQPDEINETPVQKNEADVPLEQKSYLQQEPVQPSSSSAQNAGGDVQQPSELDTVSSASCVRPVSGEVLAAFSGEELVYNETMDDWRTHNGTDFAAAYGEAVCSILAGTVTAVEEDVLWGCTVTVESSGAVLRYSGLAEKPAVRAGDKVAAGDTLGKLDEVFAEIAQEPHVHVEYEKDGKLCDVTQLLAD